MWFYILIAKNKVRLKVFVGFGLRLLVVFFYLNKNPFWTKSIYFKRKKNDIVITELKYIKHGLKFLFYIVFLVV